MVTHIWIASAYHFRRYIQVGVNLYHVYSLVFREAVDDVCVVERLQVLVVCGAPTGGVDLSNVCFVDAQPVRTEKVDKVPI